MSIESAFASNHNSTRIYYQSEEDETRFSSLLLPLYARVVALSLFPSSLFCEIYMLRSIINTLTVVNMYVPATRIEIDDRFLYIKMILQ